VTPPGPDIRFFTESSNCPSNVSDERLSIIFPRRRHLPYLAPGRRHAEVDRTTPPTDFVAIACATIDARDAADFR
jgi:hypothetical protein